MHRRIPCLVCLVLASLSPSLPVLADEACEIAVEPAATLLLPYFEVDLYDPAGVTTIFSINNAWGEPALAQVTLWTDYGIPTVTFPIFLTGYDVVTLNLRSVFAGGFLPVTATEETDAQDEISPHGTNPDWDGDFEGCVNFFPYPEPVILGSLLEKLREGHQGNPVALEQGDCIASHVGDGRVRGWITIDVVGRCDFLWPADEGYFGDRGTGLATNDNQLWGDYYLMDPAAGLAQGEPLVHVQAFDGVGEDGAWQPGDKTFYGRFVGNTAIDNREPLPSVFGARYLNSAGFAGATELMVWRDTESAAIDPVACDAAPEWYPLPQRRVYDFDEQENVAEACFIPGCPVCSSKFIPIYFDCLPLATARKTVGTDGYEGFGFHDSGWLYLDLNHLELASQAWVTAILSAGGTFSVGLPAVALASSCDGLPEEPEILLH